MLLTLLFEKELQPPFNCAQVSEDDRHAMTAYWPCNSMVANVLGLSTSADDLGIEHIGVD